jgi:hypothetical protein
MQMSVSKALGFGDSTRSALLLRAGVWVAALAALPGCSSGNSSTVPPNTAPFEAPNQAEPSSSDGDSDPSNSNAESSTSGPEQMGALPLEPIPATNEGSETEVPPVVESPSAELPPIECHRLKCGR